MAKPVILAVDDEPAVLHAVERDLRQRYGRDFRVLGATSGAQGIDLLRQIQERNETTALLVVDQRMPEMDGITFVEEGLKLFPELKKVLLTAYADTEAAINAINRVGLDYYLMKPWDPPEDALYPVLDGLLEDWKQQVVLPYEGLRVVGSIWSHEAHEIKDFLARNAVPYRWFDIDSSAEGRLLAEAAGAASFPLVVLPDGVTLGAPSLSALAEAVGLKVRAERPFYDVVIIGGGPAGLSAAVYASADGLKVLLIERQAPGGQAGNSPKIENFLGFPSGITGSDLTRRAVTQAKRFGAEILTTQSVTGLRAESNQRIVTLEDGTEIGAKIVLIATGAWFRVLDLPGTEKWNGAGIFYGAAHTEAANFLDRDVVVIGAANSAAQGLLFLARYARAVKVLIRSSEPTWSRYLDVAIRANDKIELIFDTETLEFVGDNQINGVKVRNRKSDEVSVLEASGVFVFIGQQPQTGFIPPQILVSETGHIRTGLDLIRDGKRPDGWMLDRDPLLLETSIPGVFAAGDVRNGVKHGVAAATGDGNTAVGNFWQYLSTI